MGRRFESIVDILQRSTTSYTALKYQRVLLNTEAHILRPAHGSLGASSSPPLRLEGLELQFLKYFELYDEGKILIESERLNQSFPPLSARFSRCFSLSRFLWRKERNRCFWM